MLESSIQSSHVSVTSCQTGKTAAFGRTFVREIIVYYAYLLPN